MSGFTKVFHSILASTIWREPHTTRVVWITLLAMSDRKGEVEASIPGLADMARVTIPECEQALSTLRAPDPYSRTKDNDGRRIADIEGGFLILNYEKYREKSSAAERREYHREYWHKRNSTNSTRTQQTQRVVYASASASASDQKKGESEGEQIYLAYPRHVGKPAALRAIGNALKKVGFEELLAATMRYADYCASRKLETKFIPHPQRWFREERFNDPIETSSTPTPADNADF